MYDYKTLTAHIDELLKRIELLENKIKDNSTNVEQKDPTPYTIGSINKNPIRISDIGTNSDGSIAWNNSELIIPAKYVKPATPNKGYNKHFHTRYAGGALDINALEVIEYDIDWETSASHSPHSQQFFGTIPAIKKMQNTKNENVDKIGKMALVFDADSVKWGASAFEIDVDKCYFVQKNPDGTIKLDDNGKEMKAKIYNADATKTNILWDKTALIWRWLAVYAETPTP